jgi:hypothetical protein
MIKSSTIQAFIALIIFATSLTPYAAAISPARQFLFLTASLYEMGFANFSLGSAHQDNERRAALPAAEKRVREFLFLGLLKKIADIQSSVRPRGP